MSGWIKFGVAAAGAALVGAVSLWFFSKGGPWEKVKARTQNERMQRQVSEQQRQQNLRAPFEAVRFP